MSAPWRIAGDAAPVFRGVPPLLIADVELHNPAAERVRPGRVAARVDGDHREFVVRIAGMLPPEANTRLRAQLRVDPTMPPGTYRGSVHTAGGERPVGIRVFERHAVAALPGTVHLTGAEDEPMEAVVHVENRGNVPFSVHPAGYIFFEEVDWVGRALVFALRDADAEEGYQRYLDRVVRELRSTMAAKTSVTVTAPRDELEPGASMELKLAMSLPTGLHKGRKYAAFLDIAGARLRLELVCTGTGKSDKRRPR